MDRIFDISIIYYNYYIYNKHSQFSIVSVYSYSILYIWPNHQAELS